jgi:flagellar biogenesis protein FliO
MTAQELVESFSSATKQRTPRMRSTAISLVSKAMQWWQSLNSGRADVRRLQVSATVSLGDKRFVSILECDGHRYLIGGGAMNVSLLTVLPARESGDSEIQL